MPPFFLFRHYSFPTAFYCIYISGWKDCVKCYCCGVQCLNWTDDQTPSEIHREKSPGCPMVLGCSTDNIPYNPDLSSLSEAGQHKVTRVIEDLQPGIQRLHQEELRTKKGIAEHRKLLAYFEKQNTPCVDYRLHRGTSKPCPYTGVCVDLDEYRRTPRTDQAANTANAATYPTGTCICPHQPYQTDLFTF